MKNMYPTGGIAACGGKLCTNLCKDPHSAPHKQTFWQFPSWQACETDDLYIIDPHKIECTLTTHPHPLPLTPHPLPLTPRIDLPLQ